MSCTFDGSLQDFPMKSKNYKEATESPQASADGFANTVGVNANISQCQHEKVTVQQAEEGFNQQGKAVCYVYRIITPQKNDCSFTITFFTIM